MNQVFDVVRYIVSENGSITFYKSRHIEPFPNRWKVFQPRSVCCTRTHPTGLRIIHITVVEWTLQIFAVHILLLQALGKLCHTPVLIGEIKSHRTSFGMGTFFRRFGHEAFIDILLHVIARLRFISHVITDTSRLGILQTALKSSFRIKITDTFIISGSNKRGSLITYHHIGIITSARTTGYKSAVCIIIHQGRNKLAHHLRVSYRP